MPKEKLMNRSEYAKHAGVSGQTVSQWIKKGKITADCLREVVCDDGKKRKMIIVSLADASRDRLIDHTKAKGTKSSKVKEAKAKVKAADDLASGEFDEKMSQAEAQRQKVTYQAGLMRLKYLQARNDLVSVAKVRKEAAEVGEMVKSSLASAAEHIGVILGGDDPFKMTKMLQKEFDRICLSMSKREGF
jgi:hypothetical protein